MNHALANAVQLGLPLLDAVAATTSRPADLLARPGLGHIKDGRACRSGGLNDNLDTKTTWHFPQLDSGDTTR
ncbi:MULTISPECIES: hypothetical protein [unclassified Nonomuraea]|uniref:hypothetical protein n=1 Tax=unclassified Nonomuraea TaxID=2593643 RepID=UPI00340E53FC